MGTVTVVAPCCIDDGKAGTRRPAFDHEALARALGAELEREFRPESLPLEDLAFDGGAVRFTVEGKRFAFREGELEAVADEPPDPAEDALAAAVAARGKQPNLSFFAFTATPKARTLELFGRYDEGTGRHVPFHLYSMRQAIQEGFILDVLSSYVTYKTYWNIERNEPDDPEYDPGKARAAIARFARAQGHALVGELYDAVSGADPIESRPGFAAMLERIEGNGIKVVIVADARRFARSVSARRHARSRPSVS